MGEAILDDVRKAARLLIYYTELSQEQDVVANIIKIAAGLNWPGLCKGRWLLTGLGNYHLMGEILCRKN